MCKWSLLTLILFSSVGNAVELTKVAEGFSQPLAVRSANDRSGRLFVVEQNGVIRIIDARGEVSPTPFLDLSPNGADLTRSEGERGLLGLAFHPNFLVNGLFFVNYTNNPGEDDFDTVIARYTASGDVADLSSGAIVATIAQDFGNHNGGDLHFGSDGFLYIGMGDGGSGGDPFDRSQNLSSLLGKMLRIDINDTAPVARPLCADVGNYAIPATNPFAGGMGPPDGVCPEIWGIGLRNPYRFSFDRETGDIWIGDVGQNAVEEIDLGPPGDGGRNYGWKCREGSQDFDPDAENCPENGIGLIDPVMEYPQQNERCSVTGGYRYRGPLAELTGQYLFGDFCTGEIFAGTEAGGQWSFTTLIDPATSSSDYCPRFDPRFTPNCLTGFGEGEDGEVYVVDRGGRIYRFMEEIEDLIFSDGFE